MGKPPAKPRRTPRPEPLGDCLTRLLYAGLVTDDEHHRIRCRLLERGERAKRPKAKGGTRK